MLENQLVPNLTQLKTSQSQNTTIRQRENIWGIGLRKIKVNLLYMSYEKLMSILASDKEVFFENTFEEFVFRSILDVGYEAKKKGGIPNFWLIPQTS